MSQLATRPPQAQFGQFADPHRLVADAFDAFLPHPQQSVSDWAIERPRVLNNPGGGYIGYWSHDQAPYLVAPMDALKGTTYLTVAVVGPGQCGKSTIGENWFGASVDTDPADFLWYMQTDAVIQSFVKDRINPMIADHDCIKAKLGLNAVDDSLHYKRFAGMRLEFLAAAYSNLISKKSPRIVADEIDAWSDTLGDPMFLLNVRRGSFGRESKILALSHPDKATGLDPAKDWQSGIMAAYRDSDRRVWYWPCPDCGMVSSPAPTAKYVMRLHWDPAIDSLDELAAKTVLVCPHNGCIVEDHQRRAMNIAAFNSPWGGWIGAGQDIQPDGTVEGSLVETDTAGFWIHGVMSNLLLSGIGGLARAVVKAERDIETDANDKAIEARRAAFSKGLGVPPPALKQPGSLDAQTIADRADPNLILGQVPDWVRFLTAFVDIQGLYFDVMVRGWGVGGESCIVDQFKIALSARTDHAGQPLPVDPAHEPADWDLMLGRLMTARYPLAADPSRGMAIRGTGYDLSGAPGVTAQAYAAWKRWRTAAPERAAQIKALGVIGGRDVFTVMPMKGDGRPRAQRLAVVYPDTQRKDRKVAAKGEIPQAQFSTDTFKTEMAGQLTKAEPGDWYVHFPAGLLTRDDKGNLAPPHRFFEQLVAEAANKAGHWEKIKANAKNEALDQMVGTHAVAHLHGLTRIKWDKPPPWAAPHDTNVMISEITPAEQRAAEGVGGTTAATRTVPPPPTAVSKPEPAKKSWLDRMAH